MDTQGEAAPQRQEVLPRSAIWERRWRIIWRCCIGILAVTTVVGVLIDYEFAPIVGGILFLWFVMDAPEIKGRKLDHHL